MSESDILSLFHQCSRQYLVDKLFIVSKYFLAFADIFSPLSNGLINIWLAPIFRRSKYQAVLLNERFDGNPPQLL